MVVDASALVHLLLRSAAGARVAAALFADRAIHAPHLLDIEVASAVRRLTAHGDVTAERGGLMLDLLGDLPIERHAHTHLLPRIWDLRANLSAYDATYVALAEVLGAPLLTRDGRLARAAGMLVAVEVV